MPERLVLSTAREAGAAVRVRVAGEIDMSNADVFRHALNVAADGVDTLVVDLREVSYLDSAGLATLFAYADRLHLEVLVNEVLGPVVEYSGLSAVATVRRG